MLVQRHQAVIQSASQYKILQKINTFGPFENFWAWFSSMHHDGIVKLVWPENPILHDVSQIYTNYRYVSWIRFLLATHHWRSPSGRGWSCSH